MPFFTDELFKCGLDRNIVTRALGTAVIGASDIFTSNVQPLIVDGKLYYCVSQYGSDGLTLVDDEYSIPISDIPGYCSDILPLGFRKAVALSAKYDKQILERYSITEQNAERYIPISPMDALNKQKGKLMSIHEYIRRFKNYLCGI